MSSISLLTGLLKNGMLNGAFQSQDHMTRKSARGDARGATAIDLTRALLQNAAAQPSGTSLPGGNTTGGATSNPLTANLGNLIDLRASLVKATEDTSLTIKTAEGDTVTLTTHSQVESLKAKLTYAPGDSPATGAVAMPGQDPDGGGDDKVGGPTSAKLREIKLDQSVTLSVEGDLSEQELADIRKLVARLGDELHQLGFDGGHDGHDRENDHDGDDSGGNSSLQRIDTQNLGSLSRFDLHVERTLEVTKIHMRRLPDAPPVITPTTTGVNPASVPGKGTISTPPEAVQPPVKGKAKPKPQVAPAPPKPEPAWKVDVFNSKIKTVADLLFQRTLGTGTMSGAPTWGSALPPLEEPVTKP